LTVNIDRNCEKVVTLVPEHASGDKTKDHMLAENENMSDFTGTVPANGSIERLP